MLFCFGLFALLLYYTVVANAECSYTYRHSSPQPIEARSWEYQKQGFTRCQYLIQLVNQHQQLKLNFTRLTGFGLYPHPSHQHHDPWEEEEEGAAREEEEEEEEDFRTGRRRGPKGNGGAGEPGWLERDDDDRTRHQSQGSRFFTSSTARSVEVEGGWSSVRSPVVASTRSSSGQQVGSGKQVFTDTTTTTTPWTKTVFGGSPSPSMTTTVWPIPGGGGGGGGLQKGHVKDGDPPCLPMLEIRAVDREGRDEMRHRICRQHHPTQEQYTPIVFHYASSVRIVYEWALGHSSGFTLFFHFTNPQPAERCVHTCDGATRCLSEARMLCDGRYDCRDRSDERTPVCLLSTAPSTSRPLDGESLVQIIVIPSCAVVVVVVLSAVCLIGRRRWYEAHAAMHRSHGPSAQRSCHQSPRSESSVTRACSAHDCNEQVVALLPSSHRSHRSWRSSHSPHSHPPHSPALPPPPQDPHIDLPPNIPVSPDGEEGYAASQLGLMHPRYHSAHSDMLFRPPPNKTVFDRESPPPYSVAPSPGTYCSSAPCPTPMEMGQGRRWPGHSERVLRNSAGQATVSRCYSMITPSDLPHSHIEGHPLRPGPGVHNDCARPDPQRLSLFHGACRVKDTLYPSSPPHPPVEKCPPTSPASSSASPAVLLSSSGETTPCSPPPDSRTVLPGHSVCSTSVGQDSDSSGGGESQAHRFAQRGAPPFCQGALHWTGNGDGTTWDVSQNGATSPTATTTTTTSNPAGV